LRLAIATPLFFLASWISLRRRLFHIKWRDLCTMMLMGSMLALSQACYVAAISSAGVSVSTLIAICQEVFLVGTSILLERTPS
jgi:drug/metabolite transporter, DME family